MICAKTRPPILATFTISSSRTCPFGDSLPSPVRNRLRRESLASAHLKFFRPYGSSSLVKQASRIDEMVARSVERVVGPLLPDNTQELGLGEVFDAVVAQDEVVLAGKA